MRYSEYSLESITDDNYRKLCSMFFDMAKEEETKEKLGKILYDGGYQNYGLTTNISKDNSIIEMKRRIGIANLLVQNPDVFDKLAEQNINVFHGTHANALPSILKHGIKSYDKLTEDGISVLTGEESTRVSGRSFISFTDVFDIAKDYSRLSSTKDDKNLSFGVIVGTTKDEVQQVGLVPVRSDVPEIGVKKDFPKEKIKVLCVPPSRVEYVKKIMDNDDIEVLGVKGMSDTFYYVDDTSGQIYINQDKYDKLKTQGFDKERSFRLSELKDLIFDKLFSKNNNSNNVVGEENGKCR